MPLKGYLQTTDPGRISTIGTSLEQKKKLIPTKLHGDAQAPHHKLVVRDCPIHLSSPDEERSPYGEAPEGGLVPVELFQRVDANWQSIGIAKCCVLCWRIIVPPTPSFPVAQQITELPYQRKNRRRKELDTEQAEEEAERTWTRKVKALHPLISMLETGDVYSTKELVETLGFRRAAVMEMLGRLIRDGRIEIVEKGGGRGKSTTYRWKKAP